MSTRRARKRASLPVRRVFPCLEVLDDRWPPGETLLGALATSALLGWELFGAGPQDRLRPHGLTDTTAISLLASKPGDGAPAEFPEGGGSPPGRGVERQTPTPANSSANDNGSLRYGWNPLPEGLGWGDPLSLSMVAGDPMRALPGWSPSALAAHGSEALAALRGPSVLASGELGSAPAGSSAMEPPMLPATPASGNARQEVAPAGENQQPVLPPDSTPSAAERKQITAAFDAQPLRFEANEGQTDGRVDFLARSAHSALFLRPTEAVLSMDVSGSPSQAADDVSSVVLRMEVVGGNPGAAHVGREQLPGTANYFVGSDPARWQQNVPSYAKVEYQGIYPGVDLVYHGSHNELEYDFVVAPGTDPGVIRLRFLGATGLSVDRFGNLVVHTAAGDMAQHAPVLYQEVNGIRHPVAGGFVLAGGGPRAGYADAEVRFSVGKYDRSRPLVIDPSYSTYLGGTSDDAGYGVGVDGSGNAWVAGRTKSSDFPKTTTTTLGGAADAYVAKLSLAGNYTADLLYSTYLGGLDVDEAFALAVDASGNAYVAGKTTGGFSPLKDAMQSTFGGGNSDAWVAKLDPTGGLTYATYLGGTAADQALAIAVDDAGNAYIAGSTASTDFPTTTSGQTARAGGIDAFVTKLSTADTKLYSRYLGGTGDDFGEGIAVDPSYNAYVTGKTTSTNFPTTSGAFQSATGSGQDAFVVKLDTVTGGTDDRKYSSYLGGSGDEEGLGIAADANGKAYLTGLTLSTDFPTTAGAFQTTNKGGTGSYDAFIAKVDPTMSGTAALRYSSYLGGSGTDDAPEATRERGRAIAVDPGGCLDVYGLTNSPDFPTAASGAYFGLIRLMRV
jgi:hypothetical protein